MKPTKNSIQDYCKNKKFGLGATHIPFAGLGFASGSGEIYWKLNKNKRILMDDKIRKLKQISWEMYKTKYETSI